MLLLISVEKIHCSMATEVNLIHFFPPQENNKSQGNKSRFQSTRTLGRKSKTKNTKSQELSIERKPELDIKPVINPEVPTQTEIFQMQQQSLSKLKTRLCYYMYM